MSETPKMTTQPRPDGSRRLPDAEPRPQQYVITSLSIDEVILSMSDVHPETTPIGPFDSREAAWDHAALLQKAYGNGGGSVEVAPLHRPAVLR